MKIAGIQKLTLLDFPGRCAATIFTPGCDIRCPFCHNASLVDPASLQQAAAEGTLIDPEDVLSFLRQRFGRLTGLAVTGGEPLMQDGLSEFLLKAKAIGYAVKLDTNGTYPDRLQSIIDSGAVDYIAMDFKNSRGGYAKTAGLSQEAADGLFDKTLQSAKIIQKSGIDHEFRTTVVAQLHTVEDIMEIAGLIAGIKDASGPSSDKDRSVPCTEKYFLQSFTDSGDILGDPSSAAQDDRNGATQYDITKAVQHDRNGAALGNITAHSQSFSAHSKEVMQQMLEAAREFIPQAQLRGI